MLLARCNVLKLIPRKINTNLDQAEKLIFTYHMGRDLKVAVARCGKAIERTMLICCLRLGDSVSKLQ